MNANLATVRERIRIAAERAGRPAASVRLIAVSKGQPEHALRVAYGLGQREFGENYVQELKQKAKELQDLPDLRLRFVGRLQSNKSKDVVALGCAVDSLDSLPLAEALSRRALALGQAVEVLLQVNVDREPQKAGVLPDALPALVDAVRALPALSLEGLMCIPRASDDPEQSRPAFVALRALAASCGLPELSMGMSHDLEVAIEEGATMVRVGAAIFGPRG